MQLFFILAVTFALAQPNPRVVAPSANDVLAGRDQLSWSDHIVKSGKSAHEWFKKVVSRGSEFARSMLQKLSPERYMALMATLTDIDSGDETQSEAWLHALTAKLTNPNPPLSAYDKGQVDGIVTSLGHKVLFCFVLFCFVLFCFVLFCFFFLFVENNVVFLTDKTKKNSTRFCRFCSPTCSRCLAGAMRTTATKK